MIRPFVLVGLVALAALGLTAATATAAAEESETSTNECAGLANCTSLPNTPWVEVPAATDGFTESNLGVIQPGTVLWRTTCPNAEVPAGRDYLVAEPEVPLLVTALVPSFNIGITGSSEALFYASWQATTPISFRPLVGCVPPVPGARASAAAATGTSGGTVRVRTMTRTLHPSETRTIVHHCHAGEHLVHSEHAVAFYRDTPPTKAELEGLSVRRSDRHGRVVVKVRTSSRVGRDDRVQIQVHAFCRAS